jgi:hypothetical protein
MRNLRWFTALAALALASCGGGSSCGSSFGNGCGNGTGGGGGGGGAAAATLTATSDVASIPSDGSQNATITAYARDANNALLAGIPVTFAASSGGVQGSPAVTDATGTATATLITAGDSTLRTVVVTVTAGSLSAMVNVQVVAPSSGSTTVQMGNGTGAGFVAGQIGVQNGSLSAGGSTSLTISLVQTGGTLFTGSATIGFNSNCIAAGTAQIQVNGVTNNTNSVTTNTGIATVTYVAKGCSGADVVTATSTVNASPLSASGTVTVAAATIGSISFVSATPTNIALKGTGDASRPESSTVVFQVLDSSNGPVSGAMVNFALNTNTGGITLTSASAISDVNGKVQTVVNAGTVATSVKVTATISSTVPAISTQSSQLTVTTGIATARNFSLSVGCNNIEGWDYDGVQTPVTARLSDRFQNPVPDGTAVTFHALGGKIGAQCTTSTTATESGVCSVNITSQAFRPVDGRIPILAMAIGEESFTDANGNGAFDVGEAFFDTSEAFEDDAESGPPAGPPPPTGVLAYAAGDFFYDFNNNGVHDGPDGNFNGVLCNDPARCAGPNSAGIGARNVIIFSGSAAQITGSSGGVAIPPAGISMSLNGAAGLSFLIYDVNGNVLPGGTTVALGASGAGLTVAAPSSFAIPCTGIWKNTPFGGITQFNFTISASTTTGTGVVTLTVTTPKGLVTIYQFNVAVS